MGSVGLIIILETSLSLYLVLFRSGALIEGVVEVRGPGNVRQGRGEKERKKERKLSSRSGSRTGTSGVRVLVLLSFRIQI